MNPLKEANLKQGFFCPSVPAIDLTTNEQVGWMYGAHIIPEGFEGDRCPRCGVNLSNRAVSQGGSSAPAP